MGKVESKSTRSPRSFLTYTSYFFHYCYVLRSLLGAQLGLVLLGGVGFAWCEGIRLWNGIYFSLITSTTVGYGDISPETLLGQCIAVFLALVGTIFFGLVVAVATQAFKVTIRQYWRARGESEDAA